MSQTYGMPSPDVHHHTAHRQPARYLVVIEAAGSVVARLFQDNYMPVAEFDAGAEEVAAMTRGLVPATGALGKQWDQALVGRSTAERAAAQVYLLSV